MKKLVQDGKVYLDGTRAKCDIEKEIFQEYEIIQMIQEELGIKISDYFKLFKQRDVWAFDNHYLPQKNRVVYIDTDQCKITIHNGVTLRTYKFNELNDMWFFNEEDCLKERQRVLENGKNENKR